MKNKSIRSFFLSFVIAFAMVFSLGKSGITASAIETPFVPYDNSISENDDTNWDEYTYIEAEDNDEDEDVLPMMSDDGEVVTDSEQETESTQSTTITSAVVTSTVSDITTVASSAAETKTTAVSEENSESENSSSQTKAVNESSSVSVVKTNNPEKSSFDSLNTALILSIAGGIILIAGIGIFAAKKVKK